jgi:hypothetical protein
MPVKATARRAIVIHAIRSDLFGSHGREAHGNPARPASFKGWSRDYRYRPCQCDVPWRQEPGGSNCPAQRPIEQARNS